MQNQEAKTVLLAGLQSALVQQLLMEEINGEVLDEITESLPDMKDREILDFLNASLLAVRKEGGDVDYQNLMIIGAGMISQNRRRNLSEVRPTLLIKLPESLETFLTANGDTEDRFTQLHVDASRNTAKENKLFKPKHLDAMIESGKWCLIDKFGETKMPKLRATRLSEYTSYLVVRMYEVAMKRMHSGKYQA